MRKLSLFIAAAGMFTVHHDPRVSSPVSHLQVTAYQGVQDVKSGFFCPQAHHLTLAYIVRRSPFWAPSASMETGFWSS